MVYSKETIFREKCNVIFLQLQVGRSVSIAMALEWVCPNACPSDAVLQI